jgi:hypothetical protein
MDNMPKIGDHLYWIFCGRVEEKTITDIETTNGSLFINLGTAEDTDWTYAEHIGKSLFTTREEANAVLAKMPIYRHILRKNKIRA